MTSFATPADLLLRFDSNLLGMLVNDNGQQLTPMQLQSDNATQAALDDATGMIQSALFVAYKYTAADLAGITYTSAALLKRLCCDLAIVMLCQRRGYDYSDKYPMLNMTLDMIQKLRYGERVLDLSANEQAGLASASQVTVVQQERAGLVVSNYKIFPMSNGNSMGREW